MNKMNQVLWRVICHFYSDIVKLLSATRKEITNKSATITRASKSSNKNVSIDDEDCDEEDDDDDDDDARCERGSVDSFGEVERHTEFSELFGARLEQARIGGDESRPAHFAQLGYACRELERQIGAVNRVVAATTDATMEEEVARLCVCKKYETQMSQT